MSIFIRNIASYNVVRDSRHKYCVFYNHYQTEKCLFRGLKLKKKIPEMFSLLSRLLNLLSLGIKGSSSIQCI